MVATEMPEPIAGEFKDLRKQNLGLSLKLALENLTQEYRSSIFKCASPQS